MTVVIIDRDEYTSKVNEFILNNNIVMIQMDPTAELDVYKRQLYVFIDTIHV